MTVDPGRSAQRPGSGTPAGAGPDAGPGSLSGGEEAALINQPFDRDSLYALRAAVAAHAAQAGLPQERGDDLVVAAHELAANVIRHGAGQGWLRLWQHGQVLWCQVTDRSEVAGGDHDGAAAAGAPARWPIEHGHGLWLVSQVADELSLRTGPAGSIATISFALRG